MIIYSEGFHDKAEVTESIYDDFIAQAQECSFYDEDSIHDLIYFIQDTFYPIWPDKAEIKESTLLKRILYALNYISVEDIMSLKGHELIKVITSRNPKKTLQLYL